jgi:hypothetical protein
VKALLLLLLLQPLLHCTNQSEAVPAASPSAASTSAPDVAAQVIATPPAAPLAARLQGFLVNADLERDIWAKGFASLAAGCPGASGSGPAAAGGSSKNKAVLDYRSFSLLLTEPLFNFDSVRAVTEEVSNADGTWPCAARDSRQGPALRITPL